MAEETLIGVPGTFGENGNFLIERELGRGGMGGVYMGRDKMLDRPVAVKVMLKEYGEDAEFLEKFRKEAQAAARLIHPNIAQVYSYGVCDGLPYMAMELVAGGSLYTILSANRGKADIQRVLKICQQVALALQCASDQGFVHGDVKPENILLDANGNAKLVDFGLAGMQNSDEIWGTPYYISPEKVRKEPIDFRADMYSLGGTLYHALTGVPPFEGTDAIEVVKMRFTGAPKKPSELRPEITPAVDALVMTMLAERKEERYPSFEALLRAFQEVLTSGLTKQLPTQDRPAAEASAAGSAPASGAKPASATAKRTIVRGRRMMMKRPGAGTAAVKSKVPEAAEEETDKVPDEDEEESGGSLGAKVVLFVVGGLLAIGAVVGGLCWYIYADKQSRAHEKQAQIERQGSLAREAIAGTRAAAVKFDNEFREFSSTASKECQRITDELKRLLPDWADQFKPAPSEELVRTRALTNEVAAASATNVAPTAVEAPAATNAPSAAAAKPAAVKPGLRKYASVQEEAKALGIPVPEGEIDPASPEGEEFYKKLKEARKKVREADKAESEKKKAEAAKKPEAAKPAGGEASADAKDVKKAPAVLDDIHDLWNRAYACEACQIRLSLAVRKVLAECDRVEQFKSDTEENLKALGDLSQTVKDLYDQLNASKDVETVRKGIGFIKSKGKKAIESTVKRLRIEKLEADRKARAEAQAAAEKKRQEELAAAKAAKIKEETDEIRAKFNSINDQGCFRQLDWASAIRQLKSASEDFKTAEGQLAAQLEMRKVEMMKKVQDIFLKRLKGYVFRTNRKIRGARVAEVNDRQLVLVKADGKTKLQLLWQKFYKDYPGNFNEIINHFIVNGKKNISLPLKDQCEAMLGAAMTMKLVCSEVNGANERANELAKKVVQDFAEMENTVKEIFPDLDLESSDEEGDGEKKETEKKASDKKDDKKDESKEEA